MEKALAHVSYIVIYTVDIACQSQGFLFSPPLHRRRTLSIYSLFFTLYLCGWCQLCICAFEWRIGRIPEYNVECSRMWLRLDQLSVTINIWSVCVCGRFTFRESMPHTDTVDAMHWYIHIRLQALPIRKPTENERKQKTIRRKDFHLRFTTILNPTHRASPSIIPT